MKKSILFIAFVLSSFLAINSVSATTYYVSAEGTSSGAGTKSNPMSFTTAIGKSLTAGDSIIVRGGFYSFTTTQTWSKNGNSAKFITMINYADEIPVLDFSKQAYNSSNIGLKISGTYLHVKGLTIQGAGDNGMQVTGSYDKIENCTFRWNCDTGLQLKTGSDNLILNCDSYENFDYMSGGISSPDFGGNADGFADKQYSNPGTNTFKGCRAWKNADDGWDSYEKIGNTVYDSCWCFDMAPATFDMSKHIRFKTDSASWFYQFKSTNFVIKNYGNGNGFKVGGNYTANNATLRNCVAVGNPVKGFDQNNNNGVMTVYNCTAYKNGYNYGFSNSSYGTLIIKNCASLSSSNSDRLSAKIVTQANNSWNSGFACVSSDFVSLDVAQLYNSRNNDGSLPEISLLHQKSTSGMIDKGTNVGLDFVGAAPDLGAFEFVATTAVHSVNADSHTVSVLYNNLSREISVIGDASAIDIYQVNGVKVISRKTQNNTTIISTTDFPKGIYLIRTHTLQGGVESNKILIN